MIGWLGSRRALRWESLRGPRGIAALLVCTALGAGLFPFAPGTMGTIAGLPIAYYTADAPLPFRLVLWASLLALGVWGAKVFDELMGSSDNQNIVIDEVVGLGISAWTAGTNAQTLAAAFILFRVFDILKPPPVRQIDRWSKIQASQKTGAASQWWGGFGVMADDVAAGFQALAVIVLLQTIGILP